MAKKISSKQAFEETQQAKEEIMDHLEDSFTISDMLYVYMACADAMSELFKDQKSIAVLMQFDYFFARALADYIKMKKGEKNVVA